MANVAENATWEPGVYQIETNDPVLGGANGVANTQAKQLANRTKYLKQYTDEVVNARGGQASLDDRLDRYDVFDPDGQNAVWGAVCAALGLAGLANREVLKTLKQRMQSGTALIKNRGIISGCIVSKSATAVRNISATAGAFFMLGRMIPFQGEDNGALVPSNPDVVAKTCYAYLFIDGNGVVQFACTELGGVVPDDGLPLYLITVPAGNTEATDQYLANVTLSDVRRVETGYPTYVSSQQYASIALPYDVGGSDYIVLLEVTDAKGGWSQRQTVYPGSKASNGFKIYVEGSIDAVSVRWHVIKLGL